MCWKPSGLAKVTDPPTLIVTVAGTHVRPFGLIVAVAAAAPVVAVVLGRPVVVVAVAVVGATVGVDLTAAVVVTDGCFAVDESLPHPPVIIRAAMPASRTVVRWRMWSMVGHRHEAR